MAYIIDDVSITLKEKKRLEEILKETSVQFFENEEMTTIEQGAFIKRILEESKIAISLQKYKELQKTAEEKKESIFQGEYEPTQDAIEAKSILENSKTAISLQEYRELQKTAKEKEESIFKGEYEPTRNAVEAQEILENAKIAISLQEYRELQKTAKEKEESIFKGEYKLTQEAIEAESILNKGIILDEDRQISNDNRFQISTTDIGKGTLKEQENTLGKKKEEKAEQIIKGNEKEQIK